MEQARTDVVVGGASDTGRVRDENQDAFGHFSEQGEGGVLFVVADGMGGHAHGREASSTTVSIVKDTFFDDQTGSSLERLRRAFTRANGHVHESVGDAEDDRTAGTTATALALVDGKAYLAHVGDSRAYRVRAGEIEQLTQDHTVVREMQRRGVLTAEEAQTHPRRGVLTRAVGVEPTVEIDVDELDPPQQGDHFLLCSDGLDAVSTDVLRDVVLENAPQEACEQLVQRANDHGGHDNVTALVVRVGQSE